jgi:pimeloyl-ACP methyl ester carboxylesterase
MRIAIIISLAGLALAYPTSCEAPLSISSIKWTNCTTKLPVPGLCGTLVVPLDYTDATSNATLSLSLFKVEAAIEPSKGSILTNPGGPGNSGVEFLQANADVMLVMTGGHYDVIGFDPRGTGTTLQINCYTNPIERIYSNVAVPTLTNSSDTALGAVWAGAQTYANRCYENVREAGQYMGTAFVARDMMQIVDALGEDGMLRYWGQSYGTVLGATAAALFPDRIDKMVIDGVVNLHEYTDGWEYEPVPYGDVALAKFLEACVTAGHSACALARPNSTVAGLTGQIHDLLHEVKFEPIVMGSDITTDIVTSATISAAFQTALRIQIAYAIPLAGYLDAIMQRNTTAFHIYTKLLFGDPATAVAPANPDALSGIRCGDGTFRASTLSDVRPRVDAMLKLSNVFGDVFSFSFIICSLWKIAAKERYSGDFKIKTKNPMLIIGSPFDMRTPLVNAFNASEGFEGSVVLQHNGYGVSY